MNVKEPSTPAHGTRSQTTARATPADGAGGPSPAVGSPANRGRNDSPMAELRAAVADGGVRMARLERTQRLTQRPSPAVGGRGDRTGRRRDAVDKSAASSDELAELRARRKERQQREDAADVKARMANLEDAAGQQRKDAADAKARVANLEAGRRTTTGSGVVLGLVVAWQIVLTVGLVYALTGQPAEQPADQATCPSPDE